MGYESLRSAVNSAAAAHNAAQTTSMGVSDMMAAINNSAAMTNAFNAQQAQLNRDFQLYMSNTAHQREMADLAAAGLNPILAARQGASTGSGSAASGADASGAIAGLLGQVLSAQSAQAIADRNNSMTKLIQEMKQQHEVNMKEKFPDTTAQLIMSFLSGMNLSPADFGKYVASWLNKTDYWVPENPFRYLWNSAKEEYGRTKGKHSGKFG